jgi:hypothetical protein
MALFLIFDGQWRGAWGDVVRASPKCQPRRFFRRRAIGTVVRT